MPEIFPFRCFTCGEHGHARRNCPSKPKSQKSRPPERRPQEFKPEWRRELTDEERAENEEWAQAARSGLAAAGARHDAGALVITEFRRHFKMPLRTENELREMARRQVAELRGQPMPDANDCVDWSVPDS